MKLNNENHFQCYETANIFSYFFDFDMQSYLMFENNVTIINNAYK